MSWCSDDRNKRHTLKSLCFHPGMRLWFPSPGTWGVFFRWQWGVTGQKTMSDRDSCQLRCCYYHHPGSVTVADERMMIQSDFDFPGMNQNSCSDWHEPGDYNAIESSPPSTHAIYMIRRMRDKEKTRGFLWVTHFQMPHNINEINKLRAEDGWDIWDKRKEENKTLSLSLSSSHHLKMCLSIVNLLLLICFRICFSWSQQDEIKLSLLTKSGKKEKWSNGKGTERWIRRMWFLPA